MIAKRKTSIRKKTRQDAPFTDKDLLRKEGIGLTIRKLSLLEEVGRRIDVIEKGMIKVPGHSRSRIGKIIRKASFRAAQTPESILPRQRAERDPKQ